MTDHLLEVKQLKKYFPIRSGFLRRVVGHVKAVDDVSFHVNRGETLALVGESGCGKTTTARCILRAVNPTSGQILFRTGNNQLVDVAAVPKRELRPLRRQMQMIFQDPYASMNQRMTVGKIVAEPLEIFNIVQGKAKQERVQELFNLVGLSPSFMDRYPHEFSGGQRQRIGIARALALEPEFLVCDEPIAALDVSIQAQVVNLLKDLQTRMGLTYLFIAHDLSMVRHISDRVAVMYLGKIVEMTDRRSLYREPLHPYTQALLSAIPIPDPDVEEQRRRVILEGELPSPANPPSGCRFHTRCPQAQPVCREQDPEFRVVSSGHEVACHLVK